MIIMNTPTAVRVAAHLQSPARAAVLGHVDRFVASASAPPPRPAPAAPPPPPAYVAPEHAPIDDSQPDAFDRAVAAMTDRGEAFGGPAVEEDDAFDRAVAAMPLDIDADDIDDPEPAPPPWGVQPR